MRPNSDVTSDINFDFHLRRAERRRARFIRVIFQHYLNRIRRAAKPEARVFPAGDVWA